MRYSPGNVIDRFEIVEVLGQGAYAETYLARDSASGGLVVLKCPDPNLFSDPAIFQRYAREADIARSIEHPGVQRAIDGAGDRAAPYLVLEYVHGGDLRREMRTVSERCGHIPVDTALDWGRQLADALGYLHAHGVVHRDLKPENVLVDDGGRLKVADFGTALLEGAKRLTWKHLSDGVGTPDYMSPEQIQGERGDERSDVYAWGIMMYEFLAGSVPFRGDNWMATMAAHLTKNPQPISKTRRDLPRQLEVVVLRAMRRYPEHRYQTIEDLRTDLAGLDDIDPATFDLSPEQPMGGFAASDSARRIWIVAGIVAAIFIGVVTLIIGLSMLL
jgi:eukaryotic-like serine/threonine-protein kinase